MKYDIQSIFFDIVFILSSSCSNKRREITEMMIIKKIDINVMLCKKSSKVSSLVGGIIFSTMYLLPIAANKPPTHNPKRGSV